MNCLVFGKGPWGKNIERTLKELGHHIWAVTASPNTIALTTVDAAFVATPPSTHAGVVADLLRHKIPTFCEKPFTTNFLDAVKLEDKWKHAGRPVFLVDHLQLFNPHVEAMQRTSKTTLHLAAYGPGPYRKDCSGLWDWGSHAVAEMLYLCGYRVTLFSATSDGQIISDGGIGELIHATFYANGCNVQMTTGNGGQTKEHWHGEGGTPPLTNAIRAFLAAVKDPNLAADDARFGMRLPVEVTRILTLIDARLAGQGVPRLPAQPPTL